MPVTIPGIGHLFHSPPDHRVHHWSPELRQKFDGLPKEVRERIWYFLCHPLSALSQHESDLRDDTLEFLIERNPDYGTELSFVIKRILPVDQHVFLCRKAFSRGFDVGYPLRQITIADWVRLQSLVIKLPYSDASTRDGFGNPIALKLRLPSRLAPHFNRLAALQGSNTAFRNIRKVRYDLEHIPEIGNSRGKFYECDITGLSHYFPFAGQVWAEATGPVVYPLTLEMIRAFNMIRRYHDPGRLIENALACLAAMQGKPLRQHSDAGIKRQPGTRQWESNFWPAMLSCALFRFKELKMEKNSGWADGVRNGDRVEMICQGCYAKFRSEDFVKYNPEAMCTTVRTFAKHKCRALEVQVLLGREVVCERALSLRD